LALAAAWVCAGYAGWREGAAGFRGAVHLRVGTVGGQRLPLSCSKLSLPGDWNGRMASSHEFIFHFNRAPRKPHKTVPSKHAGETLGGGGLRGADGKVHAKTGTGNAIQSHRIPDSVFRIMRHKGGLGAAGSHPAVFPVALVEAVLTAFSDQRDLIYEPFCGSGTQLVAAERSGRRCFAMELDPVYCDVAVRQWEIVTGKVAGRRTTADT